MPFQTGVVASFAALKTEMLSFFTANGWTQETDIIKRNGVFAKITTGTTPSDGDNYIRLEGGKGSDGSGNLVAKHDGPGPFNNNSGQMSASFGLGAANAMVFPITYNFQLFSSPVDEFWCFIQFNGDRCQHMGFGNINKSASFSGGGFYSSMTAEVNSTQQQMYNWSSFNLLSNEGYGNNQNVGSRSAIEMIPFHGARGIDSNVFAGSVVHAEVGGSEWFSSHKVTNSAPYPLSESMVAGHRETGAMQKVSESTVNGMPNLIPFNLRVRGYDNNLQTIGSLENIRFSQIGLMNFGQVESDGTDRWKFYPLYKKDASASVGGVNHTGTMGLAVRYDGP
ncbi:hypothetical protein OAE19_05355 [Porticoccaceae bacterium]|nr:hypothetical protein [Porticoccaceae bacterium]